MMKHLLTTLYRTVKDRRRRATRRNLLLLLRFSIVFLGLVALWTVLFQVFMQYEGRQYSWVTSLHWVLTVMLTHGPDVLFESDLGRVFTIVVMISGIVGVFVLLPFVFIEFFYEPWMKAQTAARAPRQLPPETHGHVILTNYNVVTDALIEKLTQYKYRYILLVQDLQEALRLYDAGIQVVVGNLTDPETYRRVRVEQAVLVAATGSDEENTSVVFTVRELSKEIPIIATTNTQSAAEILKLAGATHVLELAELMGQSLARRTNGGDAMAHVIGQFDELQIAEATAASIMVGKTIRQLKLPEKLGVQVLGVWERGHFEAAGPERRITQSTVLVLAGSKQQLAKYDDTYCIYNVAVGPVVIIGAGRVGRAVARSLAARELDYRIIEKRSDRVRNSGKYVLGDAAELKVLERADIKKSPAVVITTHEATTNIYLIIFLRRLRPDIQIVSRSVVEANAPAMHRAGADFVMSYASMGANTIFNLVTRGDLLMVAEGLDLFRVEVPDSLTGKTIAETSIREQTGCSVIGIEQNGATQTLPDPSTALPAGAEMLLIGSVDAENRFLELYGKRSARG